MLSIHHGEKKKKMTEDQKQKLDERLRKPVAVSVWTVATLAVSFSMGLNLKNFVEDPDIWGAVLVLALAVATIYSGTQTFKTVKNPKSDFIQKQR